MSIAGGGTLIDRLTPTRANTHLTDRETRIMRERENRVHLNLMLKRERSKAKNGVTGCRAGADSVMSQLNSLNKEYEFKPARARVI